MLTCPTDLSGTFGYSVAVTDSQGSAASAGTNLTVTGTLGNPIGSPAPSSGRGPTETTNLLTALAAALAITLACGIAVVTVPGRSTARGGPPCPTPPLLCRPSLVRDAAGVPTGGGPANHPWVPGTDRSHRPRRDTV